MAPSIPAGGGGSEPRFPGLGEKAPSADADVTPPSVLLLLGTARSAQQLQMLLCLVGLSHVTAT